MCFACLFGGLILAAAMNEYNSDEYGINTSSNPFVPISGACELPIDVLVTFGCPDGAATCTGKYRQNCELPFRAGAADLAMSVFMLFAIVASKLLENVIIEELDEAIQTAQDYSIVVNDPNPDADNPDEWYEFFSRFGKVRYVTITRKNSELTDLIASKHSLTKKIEHADKHLSEAIFQKKRERYVERMQQLNTKIDIAYKSTYPTCRVYVTFETEENQRLCLTELEVPDIAAIFDLNNVQGRKMFRGVNVLDVCEPPEPDSVLWKNVELDRKRKMFYEFLANLCSLGLLVACYFLINISQTVSTLFLSFVIAVADATLPMIFAYLTDLSAPHSEGKRQSNLQVRLFLARFLLSTLFPYLQSSWNGILDADFIAQAVTVQIAACFVTPILAFFDLGGILTRNVISPLLAETQGELNTSWMGSDWSLAERYTGIAKILFVSLFYTLLNPIALVIAMVAFFMVFLIDRFLLLRRWKPTCMLDAEVARRLRQQGILAVAIHMAVTTRFIYSWPMDQVYVRPDGAFGWADKYPSLRIWLLTSKDWMTSGQADVIRMYRITALLVCAVTMYIWIIDPIFRSIHKLFFVSIEIVGDAQDTPFTAAGKTPAYVPTILFRNELFLCSCIKDLLPRNRPKLLRATEGDLDDLSVYVPRELQPHVLSVVKYYGDPEDVEHGMGAHAESKNQRADAYPDISTVAIPKYVTDQENTLELVAHTMPLDLLEKINGKRAEDTVPPLSPEERKARRVKRNLSTRTSDRLFPTQVSGRARINPLPPIGSEDFADTGNSRPGSLSASSRQNRLVLKPIPNSP